MLYRNLVNISRVMGWCERTLQIDLQTVDHIAKVDSLQSPQYVRRTHRLVLLRGRDILCTEA
jgi:hypothetical protein